MTRWILVLACVLGLPVSAPAGSHVTILSDKILTGVTPTEFVPRFVTYLPKSLVVPAGQAVTLPADSTWDAIEVAGTLRCARATATVLRFTHMIVLPGGTFDCGTEAAPVSAVLIVRNVPIDTSRDPFQLGNGLINFGHRSLVGVRRTPKVVLAGDVPAGARRLDLPVPPDWRVGDELFLPDLHQIAAKSPIRREPRVTIASLGAGFVTLSQPLAFAHLTVADMFGVVLRPRVFNLTRTAVLASESATGASAPQTGSAARRRTAHADDAARRKIAMRFTPKNISLGRRGPFFARKCICGNYEPQAAGHFHWKTSLGHATICFCNRLRS